jgi:glycosyltransferase involved in cell wall biosynthesis
VCLETKNKNTPGEAKEAIATRTHAPPRLRELVTGDSTQRRRAWKNYSYFLRARALWRFLYTFFARGGILDGVPGLQYCAMISIYEYWTELKIKELARPWNDPTMRLTDRMMADAPGVTTPDNLSNGRINIMIPTLNESAVIRDTVLSSLKVGPVIVLDSLSTDGTQQIAREAGATVIEHKFEGYAAQKNWGLDHLPFTPNCEWVFILDADERITPGLREELLQTIARKDAADGYFVNRVVLFMGRAIRHGGLYPSWNLRFFRKGKCRYEDRSVHEHMVCDGPSDYLRDEMIHIRSESVHEWIKKHIRYADLESDEWVKLKHGQEAGAQAGRLFTSILKYRQYLRREVWPRTPFKPFMRAVYMYLIRLGVLDGVPGMHLAVFMSAYEYMIELMYRDKLARIQTGELARPVAKK